VTKPVDMRLGATFDSRLGSGAQFHIHIAAGEASLTGTGKAYGVKCINLGRQAILQFSNSLRGIPDWRMMD
jgi:hypothetical protein